MIANLHHFQGMILICSHVQVILPSSPFKKRPQRPRPFRGPSGGPGAALAAPGPSAECRSKLAAADGSDVHAAAALLHQRLETNGNIMVNLREIIPKFMGKLLEIHSLG